MSMVIVGAGEAGVAAALRLREAGYTGALDVFGAEHHRPYERPPLSKAVLLEQNDASLPLIAAAERFEALNLSLIHI